MSTQPSASERVQAALDALGLDVQVIETERSARTAVEAADAVGCPVGAIVKSLVFVAGERPVLALVSGANRLATERLAAVAGAGVRQASADEVRTATGYAIGGVPPVGHATPLAIYCDRDLLGFETVWAAAGTPRSVFGVAPQRLVEAAGATVADLAE